MSVKGDLECLVWLQARELELSESARSLNAVARRRAEFEARIEKAEQEVRSTEKELEACQKQGRQLETELRAAEEKVRKYKDQLMAVKTNKELWALQEEISSAEGRVESIEDQSLEQLEVADEAEKKIAAGRRRLDEIRLQVEVARSEADREEQGLNEQSQRISQAIAELRQRLPQELLGKYEHVKEVRAGVAVAEAVGETCLACNFKLRPQLYVELKNLSAVLQCENCNRVLFERESLGLPASLMRKTEEEDVPHEPSPATQQEESPPEWTP
ncbi:MAG: zinc ribbon domain-containing protein [Acidobacteriota bacterium]